MAIRHFRARGLSSVVARGRKARVSGRQRGVTPLDQALDQLAVIFLRTGLDSPAAERLLRQAFVKAAARMSVVDNKIPTQSQVASLSGVSRREVRELLETRDIIDTRTKRPVARLNKLIEGWCNDPDFSIRKGKPRPLNHGGSNSEFDKLVRKYGRDITKKTLRIRLVLLGLAKEVNGKLCLVRETPTRAHYAAAASDLRFFASQLSHIGFELGQRQYSNKRIVLSALQRKSIEAMRQIAITRLGTVFSSLQSMSAEEGQKKATQTARRQRLLVSATIAVERGGK